MMPTLQFLDAALAAAFGSYLTCAFIVVTQRWHGKLSLDSDMSGVQKFHHVPVPRIGGLGLIVGIVFAIAYSYLALPLFASVTNATTGLVLLVASVPAFLLGVAEDLTKGVSVKTRLIATFASAMLAFWLLEARLSRVDVWGLDELLTLSPIAIIATAFVVGGVTNSINIIDGFHGVAGSTVVIILTGMATINYQHGDWFVMHLAVIGIGTTAGFLAVNYPKGRIFLGDGGAYFIGFWVAEVAVLTVARNPQVNAWQILCIYGYPVIEVLYSIYRKRVVRKISPTQPDRLHLHMLIYKRIVCKVLPRDNLRPWIRNAAVACVLSIWSVAITVLAVTVGQSTGGAVMLFSALLFIYVIVYTRLVRGHWCMRLTVMFGLKREIRVTGH